MTTTHRPISQLEVEIAEVVGIDALIALERYSGGRRLYIHAHKPRQELIDAIGTKAAHELTAWYGGSDIYVPCVILRKMRNEQIVGEMQQLRTNQNARKTVHELASKFRLSTNRVKSILRERGINVTKQ